MNANDVAQDILIQPEGKFRLGDFLNESLANTRWNEFRAAIAFVKYSGMRHIRHGLEEFAKRAKVKISVGIDFGGTSVEGLAGLLGCLDGRGEIWIFHNANNSTFHPKVYLFKNDYAADIVVGSGNLTEGGIYTNYEAGIKLSLDLSKEADTTFLATIEAALDEWSRPQDGLCYHLDEEFLKQLIARENVPTEAESRETEERSRGAWQAGKESPIFQRVAVPRAPVVAGGLPDLPEEAIQEDSEDVIVDVASPAAIPALKKEAYVSVACQDNAEELFVRRARQ